MARSKLRQRLVTSAIALGGAAAFGLAAAAIITWAGLFNVAATSGHPPVVAWFLHYVMKRSVEANAPQQVPPDLDDPARILAGAAHFASGCAACHGAPGQLASPIARGMLPPPPPLYSAARDFDPSQLFWIVKNGVKMTAMPAWPAQQRSDEIWSMVAFLEHLPGLRTDDYLALSRANAWTDIVPGPKTGQFDVQQCARCHGADGRGRDGVFPDIAGLGEDDISRALHEYRDSTRQSGFMQPIAASMDDVAIAAAAAYYASLPRGEAAEDGASAARKREASQTAPAR